MSWNDFYKYIEEVYHIENEDTVIKITFEKDILNLAQKSSATVFTFIKKYAIIKQMFVNGGV